MASNNVDEQDPLAPLYEAFSSDEDDENDPSAMSLVDHLEELRRRIFKSLIAIVVGAIVAFIFRDQIVHFLELPLPKEAADTLGHGNKIIVTGITEGFSVFLLVSIAAGFMLALPVVLYQTWAFIAPGLLEKEKKYSVPFIVAGICL